MQQLPAGDRPQLNWALFGSHGLLVFTDAGPDRLSGSDPLEPAAAGLGIVVTDGECGLQLAFGVLVVLSSLLFWSGSLN